MCGIAGILRRGDEPVLPAELEPMVAFLRRRGPDHAGYWTRGGAGVGHARLAIIDLSAAGNQPMVRRDGTLVVTHNGEIYNHLELRRELEAEGSAFASVSDTEVLLEGYLRWGIDGLLSRIDGMYAFGLLDLAGGRAHLCRDPLGKKPLYYASEDGTFRFASDIRSVASGLGSLDPDPESLDYYLTELSVPQPGSIWKGIRQVRPGHRLTLDLATHERTESPHWVLPRREVRRVGLEEAESLVEECLTRAIVKRTVADVPVGAFLSGGTDSGLVVALLASRGGAPLRTFTIGFTEEDFTEIPYARALARRYATQHEEILVRPDVAQLLPEIVAGMGEPFADPGAVTQFVVCREACRHVKVALSGDGGDELFGYPGYARTWRADTKAARLRRRLLGDRRGGRRLLRGMGFTREQRLALYSGDMIAHTGFAEGRLDEIWRRNDAGSLTGTLFRASLETRLLNDYLVKVDRASMMNSMEIRSPFLDRDLVPLALDLPDEHKFRDGRAKYLLRRLAQKHVDPSILGRRKRGFGLPLAGWLRGELKEMMQDLLSAECVRRRGLFRPDAVGRLVAEHLEDRRDHKHRLWALMCLELWLRSRG
ncbi:MAG TPA: asparagine synthase (glutamine-hydrolyzing) [Candidatus Saccharimonadales bacterium]|nr:asparagine synthase (glutamine-hydrolyzing) [Candidatus Saccharimonadales bacterium]